MRWTKDIPPKDGWYWRRRLGQNPLPTFVKYSKDFMGKSQYEHLPYDQRPLEATMCPDWGDPVSVWRYDFEWSDETIPMPEEVQNVQS